MGSEGIATFALRQQLVSFKITTNKQTKILIDINYNSLEKQKKIAQKYIQYKDDIKKEHEKPKPKPNAIIRNPKSNNIEGYFY